MNTKSFVSLLIVIVIITGCSGISQLSTSNRSIPTTKTYTPISSYASTFKPSRTSTITETPSETQTETPLETLTATITNTLAFTPSNTATITLTRTLRTSTSDSNRYIDASWDVPFSYIPPKGWTEKKGDHPGWEFGTGLRPGTDGCELSFATMYDPKTTAIEFAQRCLSPDTLWKGKYYPWDGYEAYKVINRIPASDGDGEYTSWFMTDGEYFIIVGFDRLYGTFKDQDVLIDGSIKSIQFE